MNFALFLEMRARAAPDAVALVDRRCRLTFDELNTLANRFANHLRAAGLVPQERVAIHLPNRAEVVIALLGAFKCGAIAVPLNWRLIDADLTRLIDHCAPACMVTTAERAAATQRAGLSVLTVDDAPRSGSFWSTLEANAPGGSALPCQGSDIANLLYTSGTTSFPKAAIHTHGMRVAIGAAMADAFRLSSADVALGVSPLFHTGGFSVFANAVFSGCKLVLLEKWNLEDFLTAIETERVTFMHMITTLVVDIARADAQLFRSDLGSMRLTWGGGHAVDPEMFERFEQRIGGVFVQGYSRTEGGLTYNPPERALRRFDANGVANRNSCELAIIDPASEAILAAESEGEIVVRGDGVTPGYWDGAAVLSPRIVAGNWQATGDRGVLESDGTLRFLGRFDDMIKTGGENVYPNEVQAVLLKLLYLKDAVVFGMPDERLGQRVSALVVPTGAGVTLAQIEQACRAALPGFKIPRSIAMVEALPRLGTQKVDIAACRQLITSGNPAPAVTSAASVACVAAVAEASAPAPS